jgi:hypothetical protein
MPIFSFPEDPIWNEALEAVQFDVIVGEYQGLVTCGRRQLVALGAGRADAECLAFVFAHRPWFEKAVEAKIEARDLAPDGNIELSSRDLRRILPA